MGATQASAGILGPYVEAREGQPLLELVARGLGVFDEFIAHLTASGHVIPYRRSGTLDVVFQPDAHRAQQETAAWLGARGLRVRVLDARAVCEEEPNLSKEAVGGVLIEDHGYVAATPLTGALTAAANGLGARLDQSRVRRISRDRGGFQVETSTGTLTAERVVMAAGSWAAQIEIEGLSMSIPIKPVRGQLLHLQWTGSPLRRVTWGERCYLVPWDDGTLLVGATVEDVGFDERTTVAGVRDLMEAACELLPHAWTARFVAARAGLRPATPDDLPIIGFSAAVPNLMYACGHYRNGVLLAPLTAQFVADVLLENVVDPMMDLTKPQRFGNL
jgi:glycine oxidase